ncbi:hypothetical protein U5801_19750 [Lamprobacter modestohalophilus]|uniref:hypothetical protein n=1 Tax=Lamprobacter modestohalophilus TaxID=1064514 RepID=UPI002ADEF549|nr:hypothetical protein [Lamprobacter modestohalophilus]MEA1052023.1 hypothetical protein [Lamprobacter modestohalophilus]
MPRCTAAPVDVSDKDARTLEALERRHNAPQGLVKRAQIILLAARGVGVRATAEAPASAARRYSAGVAGGMDWQTGEASGKRDVVLCRGGYQGGILSRFLRFPSV